LLAMKKAIREGKVKGKEVGKVYQLTG